MRLAYHIDDNDEDTDDTYETLVGPDGFSCTLTESEDRTFYRDLSEIVALLNSQHDEIVKLREKIGKT